MQAPPARNPRLAPWLNDGKALTSVATVVVIFGFRLINHWWWTRESWDAPLSDLLITCSEIIGLETLLRKRWGGSDSQDSEEFHHPLLLLRRTVSCVRDNKVCLFL